jgi:DNA-binding transcriptional LysR family regulator
VLSAGDSAGIQPVFSRRFPKARLEIICDTSTLLVEYLQQGLLDLALTIRHGTEPTGEIVGSEQLVWVAGANFTQAPRAPVPLALNPEGCIYRARALDVLTRIGRRWDLIYVSKSPTGINLAVAAGIAVTVKAARSIPPGCRIPGKAQGLPELAPVAVELHRVHTASGPECEAFAGLLLDAVRAL